VAAGAHDQPAAVSRRPTAADFELAIISGGFANPPGNSEHASSKSAAAAPSTIRRERPSRRFSNSIGEK
jgi:hypothetical protein